MKEEATKTRAEHTRAKDKALTKAPGEHRAGVWESAVNCRSYPEKAKQTIYSYRKHRFLYSGALSVTRIRITSNTGPESLGFSMQSITAVSVRKNTRNKEKNKNIICNSPSLGYEYV